MNFKRIASFVALTCGALACSTASASLYTQNYGGVLPGYYANDDSSFALTLPTFVSFGGSTAPQLSVSNNGYVYSTGTNQYVYAFLQDLDSRGDPLGVASIHYRASGDEAIITWDRMGTYSYNYSQRYTFQMVFKDNTVGLFYADGFSGSYGCAGLNSCDYSANGQTQYYNLTTGARAEALANDVPEPASLALVASGLVAAVIVRRRVKR